LGVGEGNRYEVEGWDDDALNCDAPHFVTVTTDNGQRILIVTAYLYCHSESSKGNSPE
jgi:hypothetical protein